MKALRGMIALAAVLAAAPALALGAPPAVPPGAALAESQVLLAQAGAADLFDNLTGRDSQDIEIKHRASGLICVFNPGAPSNRLVLFDAPVRGEDFACATGGAVGERTLYAAHAPGRTLEQAFAHDVAEVKQSYRDIADYRLPPDTDSPILQMLDTPPMPPSKTARFIANHQFTSVSSAVVKDWSLEFRFTCAERTRDLAAGTLQPTLWVSILAQISGAPLDLVDAKQAV
jgi:hypothetical protein